MAYFNPLMNEILIKERQQAFERLADEIRLSNLAVAQQSQHKADILTTIRKIAANLAKEKPATPALLGDGSGS